MKSRHVLIGGIGLGVGLMYALDPRLGRRRRAQVRDRAAHLIRQMGHACDATARDASNRTRGVLATVATQASDEYVSDRTVAARVRAELGLLVRHPHRVIVRVDNRCVTFEGTVEADELFRLLDRVAAVPGVAGVEDRLTVHWPDEAGPPPEPRPLGHTPNVLHELWSPTTRLLVGGYGAFLTVRGARRSETLSTLIGLALMARAVTNLSLARLTGIGAGRRAVDIQKTITVMAPVEQVYAIWARYGSYPFYLEHVLDVQRETEEQSHWTVAGPFGMTVTWDATVTEEIPNERLAWETTTESAVPHTGSIAFEPMGDDSTRVTIRLSYNPPGGALGHALAVLVGCDPKRMLDHDLVQFKSLIERGKTTAHHEEVTHEAAHAVAQTENVVGDDVAYERLAAQTEPPVLAIPEVAEVAEVAG